MFNYEKVKPCDVRFDARFQRDLNENRARAMAKSIDINRIGVPVLSKRIDRTFIVIDGQHRFAALKYAEQADRPILCEAHERLTVPEEAQLFLALNRGRSAVAAYDSFRAGVIAEEPGPLEIDRIATEAGLRISKIKGPRDVCAVQAVTFVHSKYKTLAKTFEVLRPWSDEKESAVYDGILIRSLGHFLYQHPDAEVPWLVERLLHIAPKRLAAQIMRDRRDALGTSKDLAGCRVLREVYNRGRRRLKLVPPEQKAVPDAPPSKRQTQ